MKTQALIALIDCNNFFVSCERIFKPHLNTKPVIVLSSNDSCVVARSNEAKALGIKMCQPFFEIRDLCKKYKVHHFPASFRLYSRMSQRVMKTIDTVTPFYEIYSIDEAFLTVPTNEDPYDFGKKLKEKIELWTGIPVSIGIGATKTLAKVATKKAKKTGVCIFEEGDLTDFKVEDIWGIGQSSSKKLRANGIYYACDLTKVSTYWMRKNFSICGERILRELQGDVCLPLGKSKKDQKSMQYTRVFEDRIVLYNQLENIVCRYVFSLCRQLVDLKLYTNCLVLFIEDEEGFHSIKVPLPFYSHDISIFLLNTKQALMKIYKNGRRYRRAGITALDLTPTKSNALFQNQTCAKVTKALRSIEEKFGKNVAKPLACFH